MYGVTKILYFFAEEEVFSEHNNKNIDACSSQESKGLIEVVEV